jgi:hypothetical protein
LDRFHVYAVQIGSFLPVDLDVDKVFIHQIGNFFILEGFVSHYMTPMAGGISNAQQDRLIFVFCPRQSFRPPRVPLNRIVGMLEEVGTGFPGKFIGK